MAKLGQKLQQQSEDAAPTGWLARETPLQRSVRRSRADRTRRAAERRGEPYDERLRDADAEPIYAEDGRVISWKPGARERAEHEAELAAVVVKPEDTIDANALYQNALHEVHAYTLRGIDLLDWYRLREPSALVNDDTARQQALSGENRDWEA